MAYRSILGGSPLGIIGVRSAATPDGLSSFNIDKSRNINVVDYNKSNAGSLFTGKRRIRAWADISKLAPVNDGSETYLDTTGSGQARGAETFVQQTLHSNSLYDTSILNIIEKLANTKGELKPADFAYLKNVGVYPNNRLMIARRFGSPVGDNIMIKKKPSEFGAFSTLISWIPEGEDFLKISFGEEWISAEADFKGVLNSLGEEIGLSNLGGIGGAAGNVVPLPGFTEIFQRQFLAGLGLLEKDSGNMIPVGNPNLIKEAKMRKTIAYGEAGSGLTCTVSITMTCEYELKYISGIDPTIVWMDLIGSILRFGTSESDTYGLSKDVSAKLIRWTNNPQELLKEVFKGIKDGITEIIDKVKNNITAVNKEETAKIDKAAKKTPSLAKQAGTAFINFVFGEKKDESVVAEERAVVEKKKEGELSIVDGILKDVTEGLIQKYRVKILGIINSLSGLPSTPWHITIGNPLRPVFCSGDMLTRSVSLKLGPQLAFNDLPSSITAEFTLENARPLGMQEIMAKYNTGYLRSIDVQKTYYETSQVAEADGSISSTEQWGFLPGEVVNYATASKSTPGDVNPANNNQANSLPPGNTKTNADGSVSPISSSESETKSFNQGGGGDTNNATNKDANSESPAASGPTVAPIARPGFL